jgi:tetratricopeptide (TPR) repeat protein
MINQAVTNSLLRHFALCLLVLTALTSRADDAQSLDQFLARLGLGDLRLANTERMLARETVPAKRAELARKLADGYAEELIAAADEPERFAALKSRVDKLLADVPDARTPAVEVIVLQAEYQRAEAMMLHWLEEPSDKASLEQAVAILSHVQPQLSARQQELAGAVDRDADRIDQIKNERDRLAAERQLSRQRAVAARADFFAGWAAYYLGVSRQGTAAARADYAEAKLHFCRMLDVSDAKDYEAVDAEGLGLDSVWRSRAVVGLGLAELGLRRIAAANRVFGWLHSSSTAPLIRDQADYWHLQGLLNAGLLREATDYASREADRFTGTPSAGKTSLCTAAIRAAAVLPTNQADDRRRLLELGIRGLARMRQFDALDKLIEQYKLDEGALATDFHLSWLRGRRQYLAAEKSKQADGFRAARDTLTAALAMPPAKVDVPEAGQARYYLAWARYRLDEIDAAGRLFHEAATSLRSAVPEVAVQAAWMHASCLVQLANKDKRQTAAAITALHAFKQEYPTSDEAQRVDLLITRLRHTSGDATEAIRELVAIQPGNASYLSAQYELCQLRYQLWSKAKSEPAKAEPLGADLLKTVDRFLAMSDKANDNERRLKAALLAVDVLQSAPSVDQARVTALLTSVANAVNHLDAKNPAVIEYQYRRLQLAQRTGDVSALKQAAAWIADHGTGTQYELPGLVIVAREADAAVASAVASDRAAKAAEAAKIYTRLVALLGDSPAVLGSNKNALAATSKLAQYDEELKRWPQAAERLQRLVEAAPKDRRLLRRAALATFQAGQYSQSLSYWRTLLSGLENGSDEWLEAKYFQLACLEMTNRPTAEKVLKQLKVLFPDIKSAAWREKFAELESRLQ